MCQKGGRREGFEGFLLCSAHIISGLGYRRACFIVIDAFIFKVVFCLLQVMLFNQTLLLHLRFLSNSKKNEPRMVYIWDKGGM